MKLLLDTHIWLWSALEPHRISRRAARELSDQDNELWLSPISVWELTFLHRKGRAKTPQDITTWVARSMGRTETYGSPVDDRSGLGGFLIEFSSRQSRRSLSGGDGKGVRPHASYCRHESNQFGWHTGTAQSLNCAVDAVAVAFCGSTSNVLPAIRNELLHVVLRDGGCSSCLRKL
jgi:hypothetical protein